jgi:Flp pilus assembly protein TadG
MIAMRKLRVALSARAAKLRADQRGAVAMIYALVFIAVLSALGVGVDLSNTLQLKYRLDIAADAAAIACGEAWQTDMEAGFVAANTDAKFLALEQSADSDAQLRGLGAFNAQAGQLYPQLKTGSPTINAQYGTTADGAPNVVCTVNYTSSNPTYIMRIVGFTTLTISGNSYSTVAISPYANVYMFLDTSASMMVGSTTNDNQAIATWVYNNSTSANGDPVFGTTSPNSKINTPKLHPCAFSCHDEPSDPQLTPADMQAGQTNAHAAGATTRFDVLLAALTNDPAMSYSATYNSTLGEGLLPYIRDTYEATNARANLNTFAYSVYGYNNSVKYLDTNGTPKTGGGATDHSQDFTELKTDLFTIATNTINKLTIGFGTRFNETSVGGDANAVGPNIVSLVGSVSNNSVPGASSANPRKFVIIVTDGMNSYRDWDSCAGNNSLTCYLAPGSGDGNMTAAQFKSKYGLASLVQEPNGCNTVQYGDTLSNSNPWTTECSAAGSSPPFTWNYTAPQKWDGSFNVAYAGPISQSYCTTLKNNGVTVAILETPYQPMYGFDPIYHSYEGQAQYVIYPNGPNTNSALSTALSNCASTGYYYQATSDTTIATGFVTLFNKFVGQWVHVTK